MLVAPWASTRPASSARSNSVGRLRPASGTPAGTRPERHGQGRHRLQHRRRGVVVGVDEHQRGPRQPHQLLGALGVAAEPEQVLAHAAGHRASAADDVVDLQALGQHREGVHRTFGEHPGVQAGAASLHAHAAVVALRHPRHPPGQHMPAPADRRRSRRRAPSQGAVSARLRSRLAHARIAIAPEWSRRRGRPRSPRRRPSHSREVCPPPRVGGAQDLVVEPAHGRRTRPRPRRTTRSTATAGARSSPSRRWAIAGRKPWSAGDSRNALPSALASTTLPARTACSRPGTPSAESGRSSSGSHQSSSSRRSTPCTGSRPSTVFRYRRSSRTVRSPPSTSGTPR